MALVPPRDSSNDLGLLVGTMLDVLDIMVVDCVQVSSLEFDRDRSNNGDLDRSSNGGIEGGGDDKNNDKEGSDLIDSGDFFTFDGGTSSFDDKLEVGESEDSTLDDSTIKGSGVLMLVLVLVVLIVVVVVVIVALARMEQGDESSSWTGPSC